MAYSHAEPPWVHTLLPSLESRLDGPDCPYPIRAATNILGHILLGTSKGVGGIRATTWGILGPGRHRAVVPGSSQGDHGLEGTVTLVQMHVRTLLGSVGLWEHVHG